MNDTMVSIGQVKRDISVLVNRVSYGGERILLTSRGKPKAALVSIEDYQHLIGVKSDEALQKFEAWLKASDQLADEIQTRKQGTLVDTDRIIAEAKNDLEQGHDYLRSN